MQGLKESKFDLMQFVCILIMREAMLLKKIGLETIKSVKTRVQINLRVLYMESKKKRNNFIFYISFSKKIPGVLFDVFVQTYYETSLFHSTSNEKLLLYLHRLNLHKHMPSIAPFLFRG